MSPIELINKYNGKILVGVRKPSTNFILSQIDYQNLFYEKARFYQIEVIRSLNHYVHWGVPSGALSRRDGTILARIANDLLISVALCVATNDDLFRSADSIVIPGLNPLDSMSY